jgi:hypothetical protein
MLLQREDTMDYLVINTTNNNDVLDIIKDSTLETCLMVAEVINSLIGEDAVVCVLSQLI